MELVEFQPSPWMWVFLVGFGAFFGMIAGVLFEGRLKTFIVSTACGMLITVGIGAGMLALVGAKYDEDHFIAQAEEVYGVTLSEEAAEIMLEDTSPTLEDETGSYGAAVGALSDGRQVFAQLANQDGEWLLVNEAGEPLLGVNEGWS